MLPATWGTVASVEASGAVEPAGTFGAATLGSWARLV